MKIAVMGAGGVGGYYGGVLDRSGQDVTFIARGPHLEAIRKKGLQVKSVHGDFLVSPAQATDNPDDVGPVELILFTTKTHQTDDAAQAIKPLVDSNTAILPLQNGVDAVDRIGAVVGKKHLLGGVTWLSAAIEAPGIIGHYSPFRRIILGEFDGQTTPRVQAIRQILERTGANIEVVQNISEILWTKFVFIASISTIGALTQVGIGDYRSVQETHAILADAIGEVVAVGRAKGVTLAPDIAAATLSSIDGSPPNLKPSMQRDVEAGRICELESIIGIVVRLGAQLGVPTPMMKFAYAILKPGQLKAQGLDIR